MTPGQAQSLLQQAQAFHAAGRVSEALDLCRQVLKSRPREVGANYLAAMLHAQQGDVAQATKLFKSVARLKPDFWEARYNLAYALNLSGAHEEALPHYEAVLRDNPRHVNALINYANTLNMLARHSETLAAYDKLIALQPDSAAAHANRGAVLKQLKRFGEALAACDKAVALEPNYAAGHFNRGLVLHEMGRFAEALQSHDRSLQLNPNNPESYFNRGGTLHELGRFDDALESYAKALALKPDYVDVYFNRGVTLHEIKRLDDALQSYDKTLALQPEHRRARFGRSMVHLLRADFARGWPDYEYRDKHKNPLGNRPLHRPLWQGGPIAGKRLLVYAEQGLGDTIHFCRYLPLIERQGAQVLFAPQPALKRLMRSLRGNLDVVDAQERALKFDLHCPLLSLPLALKTDPTSIPADAPYLSAEPERVKNWAEKIGDAGFRIGICWQGGTTSIDKGRSFHVREFLPLAQVEGVRLISLHKGVGEAQLAELPRGTVEMLGDDFDAGPDAFIDSAAVMQGLDLVITSDTAIAHLAGALGKPTWVALSHVPDWRWQLDRGDSPWYPTMRLFRQQRPGDWAGVFAAIRAALTAQLNRATA